MFSKLLVANRGEVAVRIIRACREMGIKTVAVYSTADSEALHTALADERVCIGGAPASESYLNVKNIISAALATGCQAIHPGYGFLAENAAFAKTCADYGLVFIGPTAEVIERMGDKNNARRLMRQHNIPIVPGSGLISTPEEAREAAEEIGYPLLVKAAAGGGGKGIREVTSPGELSGAMEIAAREAEKAFGNGAVYLERSLKNVRHIEVQLLADNYGRIAALGERDCSLQKNRQKYIEETPSPAVDEALRKTLYETAVAAARAAAYTGAGTVEFLLDREGRFYFIEMNTRLQVEHQISEEVTGVDIVKWQLRIACGMELPEEYLRLTPRGCSIECRINALSAGRVEFLHVPGSSRAYFATALMQGGEVPPYYDSMIGKLIVRSDSRDDALRQIDSALCELVIEGISTNIDRQLEIIRSPGFRRGDYHTLWLENGEDRNEGNI